MREFTVGQSLERNRNRIVCLVSITLSQSSCLDHPAPTIRSRSPCPNLPVSITLSQSSCLDHPAPTIRSRSPCPIHPVSITLSQSSCLDHPVPIILSRSPCPNHPVSTILPQLSGLDHPVPIILSRSPCMMMFRSSSLDHPISIIQPRTTVLFSMLSIECCSFVRHLFTSIIEDANLFSCVSPRILQKVGWISIGCTEACSSFVEFTNNRVFPNQFVPARFHTYIGYYILCSACVNYTQSLFCWVAAVLRFDVVN